ncbi:hypothetical protein SAMN05518847_1011150 [Paenibacillus sp. OV219]|nr:hypothetical protein SAMN05518847_1011150 [Paenibacillus sp. OV219]
MDFMLVRNDQIAQLKRIDGFIDEVVHIAPDQKEDFAALMQMKMDTERRCPNRVLNWAIYSLIMRKLLM